MNPEERKEAKIKFSNVAYYLIVGMLSLLLMTVIPVLGTDLDLGLKLPNTWAGWIVFVVTKVFVAVVNMLIFYCFMEQAKVNVRGDEHYQKANEILRRNFKKRAYTPKSPTHWQSYQYLSKGTTLFGSSVLSLVSLGNAVLTFDLISFMTICFTLIMGITFGYLQMRKAEEYWTTEYYEYALMIDDESTKKQEQEKNIKEVIKI